MDHRLQCLGQLLRCRPHGGSALRFDAYGSRTEIQIRAPAAPGSRCLFYRFSCAYDPNVSDQQGRRPPRRTLPLHLPCEILHRNCHRRYRPVYSRQIEHVPTLTPQRFDHRYIHISIQHQPRRATSRHRLLQRQHLRRPLNRRSALEVPRTPNRGKDSRSRRTRPRTYLKKRPSCQNNLGSPRPPPTAPFQPLHTSNIQHIPAILHRPTHPLAARAQIHRPNGHARRARYRIPPLLRLRRLGPHHSPLVLQHSRHTPYLARILHHIFHKHHHMGDYRPLRLKYAIVRRYRTTVFW